MFTYILKCTVYILGVFLSKNVDILNIQLKLEKCNGQVAKLILDKFDNITLKNKGWRNIKQINKKSIGKIINHDNLKNSSFNLDNYLYTKYAPTTSVDIERLSKYMVINFFF